LAGGRATFLRLFFASRRLGDSAESARRLHTSLISRASIRENRAFRFFAEPPSNRRGVDRRISPPLILRDDLKA
jgi:hypothetical protein